MLPSLRCSPVADDFVGCPSPERSCSPDGKRTLRSSIAVSWSDYPPAKERAVDARLPLLSRPTSREHHMIPTVSALRGREKQIVPRPSGLSCQTDRTNVDDDLEVRRATQMYAPLPLRAASPPCDDQLKIMRLAKVGASPSNTNPKLTRLAAMMDQYKVNEYVRLDSLPGSRPSSRQASTSTSAAASLVTFPLPRSNHSTGDHSPSRSCSPGSATSHSVADQSKNTPLGSPDKSPVHSSTRSASPNSESPERSRATRLLAQLLKEEDYWRGYQELEEGQRRYYLWTFLRRGEMPMASKTFEVGMSPALSHHVLVAHMARRGSAEIQRPSSASCVLLKNANSSDRSPLPPRPSSVSSRFSGLPPKRTESAVPAAVETNVSASPAQTGQAGVAGQTLVVAARSPMSDYIVSEQSQSSPFDTLSPVSLTSPRAAVMRELTRRIAEALDDLDEDESLERNAMEAKEEASLNRLVIVPWLVKVTPLQEESCRKDLMRIQQDVFFRLVLDTSRYLYLIEQFYMEARSSKLSVFDHFLGQWRRLAFQRVQMEIEETNARAMRLQEEAHTSRCLLRRWHQHAQVMMLRAKTYVGAMQTFARISSVAAVECASRNRLTTDCDRVCANIDRMRQLDYLRQQSLLKASDDMRLWFTDCNVAVRLQTRRLQEVRSAMISLSDTEWARRTARSQHAIRELQSIGTLETLVAACMSGCLRAVASHGKRIDELYVAAESHTQLWVAQFKHLILPEQELRSCTAGEEAVSWDRAMLFNDIVRWRDSQVRSYEWQITMELASTTTLLQSLSAVLDEEQAVRQKILDLEDEAYEDDFLICHQRMRRLDTVRSFILASPSQERRARLALEAEYREGLYQLMELNDHLTHVGRTAEAVATTKWHIFTAAQHQIEIQLFVMIPEGRIRTSVEDEGCGYASVCCSAISTMHGWEGRALSIVQTHQSVVEGCYQDESVTQQSLSEICYSERSARHTMHLNEAAEWASWSSHVQVEQVLALESIDRQSVTDTELHINGVIATLMRLIQEREAALLDSHTQKVHLLSSVQLEVQCIQCIASEGASHSRLFDSLDVTGVLPYLRDVEVSRWELIKRDALAHAECCGIPFHAQRRSIVAMESMEWNAIHQIGVCLREATAAFDECHSSQQALFEEYTKSIRKLMLPTMERLHRQRVTASERAHLRLLEKMREAERAVMAACSELSTEHHAAVAAWMAASCLAHQHELSMICVLLTEREGVLRGDLWRDEEHEMDVVRSAQRSLRWNVVAVQEHHAALRAAMQREVQRASCRDDLFVAESKERHDVAAAEFDVRLHLKTVADRMTHQHQSNERSLRRSLEEIFDESSVQLLSFLHMLRVDHPRDLAEKAAFILTNDPSCSALDFSSFDGDTHRCSDETLEISVRILRCSVHVRRLCLNNNHTAAYGGRITRRGITMAASLVNRLTHLELKNCRISDDDANILFAALAAPTSAVTALNLEDNRIGTDSCRSLLTVLRAVDCCLVDVSLQGNEGIPKGMLSVVSFYCQLNRQTPQLKHQILRIEENDPAVTYWSSRTLQLCDEHTKLICVALFQNTHITHVDLEDQSNLTDASCSSIASMLRGNASIARIDLSGTSIGDIGLQQLEHVLKQQPYRQPLVYKDILGVPPAQLLRRRSSRLLTTAGPVEKQAPSCDDGQTNFVLSIHRTKISDKKYLACVMSMNELERAMVEMDEDDAFEATMRAFYHMCSITEDAAEALRDIFDASEAAEVLQHHYFVDRVFGPLESSMRHHAMEQEQAEFRLHLSFANVLVALQRDAEVCAHDMTVLHQRHMHLAVTSLRMREWEPNHQQRIELEEIWVPEHKERKDIEAMSTLLTHHTLERYTKYVQGAWRFFDKCQAAKVQAFERNCREVKSFARKNSVMSLSQLGSNAVESSFVPMELDPKQHQALAHLGNQPWELQGKGLAIAQNDPAVTSLDISYAGVANKEEPPCSPDTIAVLFTLAKNNTSLQEINISGNPGAVTGRCAPLLAKLALRLRILNVADCALSENDVLPHLLGALSQPAARLHTLVLDGNNITAQGATLICRALRANVSVSSLSLQRTPQPIPKISLDFIQFYTDVNKLPKIYRTLIRRMEANDATCTEADFTNAANLTGALRTQSVEVSSAAGCDSDDDSVSPYGTAQSTTTLDDSAIKLVCIALSRNMVLERLLLAGNAITDRGIKFLSHIMQSSPSLRYVDVSQNKFTDAGAALLVKSAEKNSRLQDIKMTTNDGAVGVHSRRMLLAQLQKNKS